MLLDGIRTTGCEILDTLQETTEGALVAARGPGGREVVLFVPRTPEDGARERERLEGLSGPGIPGVLAVTSEAFEALVLVGADGARPLRTAPPLPDSVWRPALVRLLSALSQAHGRGWAHGRIAQGRVLADPAGGFWIWGWAGGREVRSRGPFQTGFDDVGLDLRELGLALVRHLAGADDEAGEEAAPATLTRAHARVALFDAELARVLVRLVTVDPRESYLSATEVLTDLGEPDESLPDPWSRLPFVGRRRIVRRIVAHAERAGTRSAEIASFTVVGGPGTGRSRVLEEAARAARGRGLVVLHAPGGTRHPSWGAISSFARQLLSRIAPDHPLRHERGVHDLLGEDASASLRDAESEIGDGAAAAFVALVKEGLRGARGLLVLDDADALSRHAAGVWAALAHQVAASCAGTDPIRVLLVESAVSAPEHDASAPVESEEIAELGRRPLAHLLAEILTERGRAPALAAEIESIVGGRPADVVEHLRDMVARHALVPVGRRFSLEGAVAGACSAGADSFRRAAESAGREGRALAEVLAVAGRLLLSRDVAADLAGLPAHRLNAAAESALRAGLTVREGAGWRVRTESLRVRLESGLAEDRRSGLHREILVRLLDSPEPDWPGVAHHARASGDPRAADWTRRALALLRAAGRFDEAASHFDDARTLLGPAAVDVAMRLEQVDTLLHAGRLDDALRVAAEVHADPAATPRQHGEAALALAWLHRYDQAWSKVLAVELPVECGDPMLLARMRLVRAAALVLSRRPTQADRERRLALSELPSPEDGGEEIKYWMDEVEVLVTNLRGDLAASSEASLRRLRSQFARSRPLHFALDLVLFANSQRLLGRPALARAILAHARSVAVRRLGGNAIFEARALATLSSVNANDKAAMRHSRIVEAAAFAAARTGGRTLVVNMQIALIHSKCRKGALSPHLYAELRRIACDVGSLFPDVVALTAHQLVMTLAHCGLHAALVQIAARAESSGTSDWVRGWARYGLGISGLLLGCADDGEPIAALRSVADFAAFELHARDASRAVQYTPRRGAESRVADTEMVTTMLALCVRRGQFRTAEWPERWSFPAILGLIDDAGADSRWGAPLVASLAVCARTRLDDGELAAVRSRLAKMPAQFPTPLEWLRHLAAARECYADGRIASALRHMDLARLRARVLDRPETGSGREASYAAATLCIETYGVLLRPVQAAPARFLASPVGAAGCAPSRWPTWEAALRAVAGSRSVVVSAADPRELHVFAEVLAAALPVFDLAGAAPPPPDPVATGVVRQPDGFTDEAHAIAHDRACALRDAGGRFVVLFGPPRPGDRHAARIRAAWLPLCGTVVELPSALGSAEGRIAAFAELLRRRLGAEPPVDPAVRDELASYGWPGGIVELETVASEVAALRPGRIDASALDRIGWRRRVEMARGHDLHPNDQAILRYLDRKPWVASAQIARGTGSSGRTTVRALSRLVESQRIVKRGVGRATRYATPGASTQPADFAEHAARLSS